MIFRFLEDRIREDTHFFIITSWERNDAHGNMATSFHTLDGIHLASRGFHENLQAALGAGFVSYHTLLGYPIVLSSFALLFSVDFIFPVCILIKTMPWGFHGSADISPGREGVKSGRSTPKSRFRDVSAPLMKAELINPDKM